MGDFQQHWTRTAQAPAAQLARLRAKSQRRAGAGQAAPPGPVRFGPQLVLLNIFLTHLEKM